MGHDPEAPSTTHPKPKKPAPAPFQHLGAIDVPVLPHVDLSPSSIFPPTPLNLFTTIIPMTPLDATKSPRYVKELWDNFDQFDPSSKPSRLPPLPPPAQAEPWVGTWPKSNRSTNSLLASSSSSSGSGSGSSMAISPPPVKPTTQKLTNAEKRRRLRGSYRCRKCGGAKRAHDCPFACRQKSVASQTSLEITGKPPVGLGIYSWYK